MFSDLHELAQSATLLIVVTADADQLRVSVTPTQVGDKTKPHALKPLSLLGTPAEMDADFGAALMAWQKPKKSLVQQAQDAAGADEDDDTPSTSKAKPAPKAEKGKPGPKKKNAIPPADPALDAGGEPEPEFALEPAPVAVPGAEDTGALVEEPPPPEPAPVVDTKTLDLF